MTKKKRDDRFAIVAADAVDWLKEQAPRSIDLLITDPAYESLEKHREKGTTTRLAHSKASSNDWFPIFPNKRFHDFFLAAWSALKTNAHLYVLCDQETMFVVKPIAEQCGFKFWKPLIWDKQTIGMGYHYRCRYEFVLFFEKGQRKLNDLGIPDVLDVPRVHGGYPTEKPVELLQILVRQSSEPGELVADPFGGSFSTGHAALLEGRRFAGCDILQQAVEAGRKRLAGVEADPARADCDHPWHENPALTVPCPQCGEDPESPGDDENGELSFWG